MAITTGRVVALIKAIGGGADPTVIEAAVQDWLEDHPEATTTVQDGSITEQKLATAVAQKLGLISSLSDEIGDLKSALQTLESEVTYVPLSVYSGLLVLGRSVDSGGSISASVPNSSLSSLIEVDKDESMVFPDIKDSNNIQLNFHVAEYNSSKTFIRRTLMNGSKFTTDSTTKYVRLMFSRPGVSGVTMTRTDIDTYFNGYIYNIGYRTYQDIQSLLPVLSRQFWFNASELPVKWQLGKSISSDGDLTITSTSAVTDYFKSYKDEIFTFDIVQDGSSINLSTYIAKYNNEKTFIERVGPIDSDNPVQIDTNTKYIRLMFSRPGVSGVAMTQTDIDTYFSGIVWQTGGRVQNQLNALTEVDDAVPYEFVGTWTLQETVTKSGEVKSATTYAVSDIHERGELVGLKTKALKDSGDRDFITYVVCYDSQQRYLGRFKDTVVFSAEVAYFRLVFGRAANTGIAPTQNTITTYFKIDEITTAFVRNGKAPAWDKPKNFGVLNCLLRAKQLVYLTYRTKAILPNQVDDIPANTLVTGAPYSSARLYDKFIGLNVSIHTFMTAINNPDSVVYTEELDTPNAKTFYGTVCSSFTAYALASPVREVTKKILNNTTDYTTRDINEIQLGDICVNDGHIVLIGGIERDQYGRITNVVTLESLPPKCCLASYTWQEFMNEVSTQGYRVASYNNIAKVDYDKSKYVALMDEEKTSVTYMPICTNYGDKALLKAGETIKLHVLDSTGATSISVKKDGAAFNTYSVETVTISDLASGHYVASLMNGDTEIGATSWDVCYGEVSKAGTRVSFGSFANCTPLYVSFNDSTGTAYYCIELTAEDIENGYVDTDYSGTGVNVLKVYVGNGNSSTAFSTTIS